MGVCLVCGAAQSRTHFGVQSCNACSIFFRRTVLLKRNYKCDHPVVCELGKTPYLKCSSCRIQKCIKLGMDWKAVKTRSPDMTKKVHNNNDNGTLSNKSMFDSQSAAIFNELRENYLRLNFRRTVFHKNNFCLSLEDDSETLCNQAFVEIGSFYDSLFEQHDVEPKLYLSFIAENSFFAQLHSAEKRQIFFSTARHVFAIEILFASWSCRKLLNAYCIAMPNGYFASIDHLDSYLQYDELRMNSNVDTIYKIYVLTIVNTMEIIDAYIGDVQPTHDELVFLIGLIMFDPTIPSISKDTVETLKRSRNLLIEGFMTRSESANIDGVLRLDRMCSIIAAIKIYVQKLSENFTMLRYFDVLHHDQLFDQLWDIKIEV